MIIANITQIPPKIPRIHLQEHYNVTNPLSQLRCKPICTSIPNTLQIEIQSFNIALSNSSLTFRNSCSIFNKRQCVQKKSLCATEKEKEKKMEADSIHTQPIYKCESIHGNKSCDTIIVEYY